MYATRVLINVDIPETHNFSASFSKDDNNALANALLSSPLTTPATIEEPFVGTPVVPIDELYRAIDKRTYCLIAYVLKVDTERGWWYELCRKCAKKVTPDGLGYSCVKYEVLIPSCQIRYIIWIFTCSYYLYLNSKNPLKY